MGCRCLKCKFYSVVSDNHDDLHSICVCKESDDFLKEIEIAFHNCDYGVVDDYGEEEE